ncbi:hypothetical protein [Sandarakinorhabdus limnophila]|uniref:hypothetical protein n=1 Tax=Sandarakinorhabdus limnophila TaxID=210512 RepID=UPI0026F31C8F|nr:hypothetical protein [Sandarakinorhabdus limnophila]
MQDASLAACHPSRYGNTMPNARLSAPDALLRLWMLAEFAMAGLYIWLGWGMRDWPADLPGPQPLRAVEITEFMHLFVFVPAAIVVAMRWRATRDRLLVGLALAYCALSVWSYIAWDAAFEDGAAMAGEILRLRMADAAIALAGVPVALRALRLR